MNIVCGVGINDSNYIVQIRETIGYDANGKRIRKLIWQCPFYSRWSSMLDRCYSGRYPSYKDCVVCEDWKFFTKFKIWMENQDWQNKELDKDLLFVNNKIYGPDTCVFINKNVNIFMTDRKAKRGQYPLGVCKNGNGYVALCNQLNGIQVNLGTFKNPEMAHEAWRKEKLRLAKILALEQVDYRISTALINRYSL